jgi:hypothetical protein
MRSWVGRPTLRVNLLSCFDLGLGVPSLCKLGVCISELEKQQHAAQATTTSFQNLFEAEARWTQLLQGVITSVCDGLGVEPDADT